MLEDVAVDQNALSILQFEQILDRPRRACISRLVGLPAQWLGDVVSANLDIRRHEVDNRWKRTAKHDVLAGGGEIVVHDLERAGSVPPADRLGINANPMDIRNVCVDDGGIGAVD